MEATELFAPLGPGYDRWGSVLSFGQDPRWRRFLVTTVDAGPTDTVLDVATGTAAVALELARQKDCFVVGVDITPEMLEEGRRRVTLAAATRKIRLQQADARALPFDEGTFDAVTFTYLLRYVDDPPATLRELVRVVKPGGTVSSLEFGLPRGPWRPLWELWTRAGSAARGPRDRRRLARGRAVSQPVDHRVLRTLAAYPSSWRRGGRPASTTWRLAGSVSAEAW